MVGTHNFWFIAAELRNSGYQYIQQGGEAIVLKVPLKKRYKERYVVRLSKNPAAIRQIDLPSIFIQEIWDDAVLKDIYHIVECGLKKSSETVDVYDPETWMNNHLQIFPYGGKDLLSLTKSGPLAYVDSIEVIIGLLNIAICMYSYGLVHGDLSPFNVVAGKCGDKIKVSVIDIDTVTNNPRASLRLPYAIRPPWALRLPTSQPKSVVFATDMFSIGLSILHIICGGILYEDANKLTEDRYKEALKRLLIDTNDLSIASYYGYFREGEYPSNFKKINELVRSAFFTLMDLFPPSVTGGFDTDVEKISLQKKIPDHFDFDLITEIRDDLVGYVSLLKNDQPVDVKKPSRKRKRSV